MVIEDPRSEARKRLLQYIFIGISILVVATLLVVVSFYKLVLYNAPSINVEQLPLDKKLLITIPKGASLNGISNVLQESGVIENATLFRLAARYLGAERSLKAGQYLLPAHGSNHQIIRILQNAVPQSVRVTIPEGRGLRSIIQLLSAKLPLDSAKFVNAVNDSLLCRELGFPDKSLFGYLMPNTYFIDPGTSESDIVRLMIAEYTNFFGDDLKKRAAELQLTPRQIMTIASIIEGETADDDERYLVSSVYHNRVRRGMMLQADPTIQFIIKDGPRRLYNKDLEIDSPYNTYKYAGLPPGPVNNPGKASILAALYPSNSEYLYMVADGKGKHIFSKTMEEHLRARKQLDAIRKQLEKKKK